MSKNSKITTLLIIPLIASAILLTTPAFAADPNKAGGAETRHKTGVANPRRGIAGTVASVNGDIIIVEARNDTQYTVDTSSATIMKTSDDGNPDLVSTSDIKAGDAIVVRGEVSGTEVSAEKILDGKILSKEEKKARRELEKSHRKGNKNPFKIRWK